jgi:pyruvate,water dikinase
MTLSAVADDSKHKPSMKIAHLTTSDARDSSRFGNKTANLAIAVQHGFRVPRGVGLTYDAPPDSETLRSCILSLKSPYAVRSSSLVEDGADRAFPGIFETILGVRSFREVVDAVEKVRASASGPDLINYAGGDVARIAMGVLVQELVAASYAGVAFSRDPVTAQKVVVIESSYGLGKSVVDGEITPDSHEFSHRGDLLGRRLGTKRARLDFNGTLAQAPVLPEQAGQFALSEREARQVLQLALDAEDTFHGPIDIEWAFDHEGTLWLLQARPITALANDGPRSSTK